MSVADNLKNNPETRANVVAGLLVGAVVLVLGFGSGIGAVFSRHTAYSGVASASPASIPTSAATAPALQSAATSSASEPAAGTPTVSQAARSAAPSLAAAPSVAGPASSSAAAGPSASSSAHSATSSTCTGQTVVAALADPFVAHFYHGHLEESPSQQAGDITNTDQYVKTHTVLIENMAAPAIALGLASFDGIDPFVAHLDHGHLEESPAQQAADILNVSQYVNTHTVLIENMTAPATGGATGNEGC